MALGIAAPVGVRAGMVKQVQLTQTQTRVRINTGVNPVIVQIAVTGHGQDFSTTIEARQVGKPTPRVDAGGLSAIPEGARPGVFNVTNNLKTEK
jgi:hypothetical protein